MCSFVKCYTATTTTATTTPNGALTTTTTTTPATTTTTGALTTTTSITAKTIMMFQMLRLNVWGSRVKTIARIFRLNRLQIITLLLPSQEFL